MTFGSKRLDDAYDKWATQTPEDYFGYDEDDEYDPDQDHNKQAIDDAIAEAERDANEDQINFKQEDKMETINAQNCKRTELRDVTISVRVTKSMSKFMAEKELSPSRVMIEALKQLGYKEK